QACSTAAGAAVDGTCGTVSTLDAGIDAGFDGGGPDASTDDAGSDAGATDLVPSSGGCACVVAGTPARASDTGIATILALTALIAFRRRARDGRDGRVA